MSNQCFEKTALSIPVDDMKREGQAMQTMNETATSIVAGHVASDVSAQTNESSEKSHSNLRLPVIREAKLKTETQPSKEKQTTDYLKVVRKYASLSDLLRLSGAVAVAAAMGLFLLNGIEVVNDLQRFLTMLGLTGVLTAAGLVMSMLLKEQRGSRVFIGLALLSVPVNFTVIGALLYSVLPLDASALTYPGYAHWQVGSVSDLVIGLAAGLLVLGPVVWLGLSVLARPARLWLSIALILSSVILVIPVRAELWSAALAIGTTAMLWFVCRRYSSQSLALKTTEGKFAIALLFVAPIIVAIRSLFFYDVNGVLVLTLCLGFFVCCRQILAKSGKSAHAQVSTDDSFSTNVTPGASASAMTWLTCAALIGVCVSAADVLNGFMPGEWPLFSVSIALLLLTTDMLRISPNPILSRVMGLIFSAIATLALVAETASSSGMTLWVALALAAVAYCSWYLRVKVVALTALIGILALIGLNAGGLLIHAQTVWTTILMTGWWGIAAMGALAIVAGSMIDRAGTVVAVEN